MNFIVIIRILIFLLGKLTQVKELNEFPAFIFFKTL